jgi:beta-1,2-mannobiose phosphorylase / 1,2-beta-oligomannan phosphorylase
VSGPPRLSRRQLLLGVGGLALGGAAGGLGLATTSLGTRVNNRLPCGVRAVEPPELLRRPVAPGWQVSSHNPVLDVAADPGWERGAVFDPCVVRLDDGSLAMWYSTRGTMSCIGLAHDPTGSGDVWVRSGPNPVLAPDPPEQPPYAEITRPSVVRTQTGWRMWYSVSGPDAGSGNAWIGTATSEDGMTWRKHGRPVLTPSEPWEKSAVQCPNVEYDAESGVYHMWYSGGGLYEPDAAGYARSSDGLTWTRHPSNPIYAPSESWENYKIGSFQVRRVGGWYYAFYNAFQREPLISRIGLARSQDGVSNWERHPSNPILTPDNPCMWNAAMVYKPTVLWDQQRQHWDVWFNASMRRDAEERIGHAWSQGLW